MWPYVIAALLIVPFFFFDSWLPTGTAAKRYKPRRSDGGTSLLITTAYVVALIGGPALAHLDAGRLPAAVGWIGLALVVVGIAFRSWAMRSLGQFYTRTLVVVGQQTVVENGPYRVLRHPGYAGSLTAWTGLGLSSASLPAALLTVVLMSIAYGRRIHVEEAMLQSSLGDAYRAYMKRTWRLIPFVF